MKGISLLKLKLPGKAPDLLVLWLGRDVRRPDLLGPLYSFANEAIGGSDSGKDPRETLQYLDLNPDPARC